jgi:hypothetical protein
VCILLFNLLHARDGILVYSRASTDSMAADRYVRFGANNVRLISRASSRASGGSTLGLSPPDDRVTELLDSNL